MGDIFLKNDTEKNRLELIDPYFIEGIGEVMSYGARKYTPNNWKNGGSDEDIERIIGALLRHINAYQRGEKIDRETGISHLYHLTCNAMFLAYFDRVERIIDEG